MKYTKNYRLPQWVESDRIMMNDFNSAMTNIESGIDGAKAEAKSGDSALASRIDDVDAKATAAAAKPYVIGTYTGTGAVQTIELGFKPSFLIVSGMNESQVLTTLSDFDRYFYMSAGEAMTHRLSFTDTGFTVYPYGLNGYYFPNLADKDRAYTYIAFQ